MRKRRSAMTRTQQAVAIAVAIIVIVAGVAAYYLTLPPPVEKITLKFVSPEWLPGTLTGAIADGTAKGSYPGGFTAWYKKNVNPNKEIKIEMDLVPWSDYWARLAAEFATGKTTFDLLISDSQFIGAFATGGHIVKLNDWIKEHQGKDFDLFWTYPNLVKYYCTYPVGDFSYEKFEARDLQLDTVDYWGVVHEADTMALLWRKDLFAHPDERAAFKAKYGFDLPQSYEDWRDKIDYDNWLDIAEFFTRKKGEKLAGETLTEDFYGMATWNADYDSSPYLFHGYLWSIGGEIWNEKTNVVQGFVNSEWAVEALTWKQKTFKYQAPGSEKFWFDQVNAEFNGKRVATGINAVGFAPGITIDGSPSGEPDLVGYALWPAMTDRNTGERTRWTQLVGQPMCVSAYTKYKEEALAFFSYWYLDENQWAWADGGGGCCKKSIVETDRFIKAVPWNLADRDTLPTMKDFWNVPVYDEMMRIEGATITSCYKGDISPKAALDKIAEEQTRVLREGGLLP